MASDQPKQSAEDRSGWWEEKVGRRIDFLQPWAARVVTVTTIAAFVFGALAFAYRNVAYIALALLVVESLAVVYRCVRFSWTKAVDAPVRAKAPLVRLEGHARVSILLLQGFLAVMLMSSGAAILYARDKAVTATEETAEVATLRAVTVPPEYLPLAVLCVGGLVFFSFVGAAHHLHEYYVDLISFASQETDSRAAEL